MERRLSDVAAAWRAILLGVRMGLPLFSFWLAGLAAASGTVDAPTSHADGVVLLSRRDWRAQEARLVESLHIYIRDLNLTIETHLIPHEAQSPEEQNRFAELRCEPEVAMVFWFAQDENGPGLTTLRCEPRELRMLPLPAGAAGRRDLDVVAHGLALKLRAMLVGPPRDVPIATRTAPPTPVAPTPASPAPVPLAASPPPAKAPTPVPAAPPAEESRPAPRPPVAPTPARTDLAARATTSPVPSSTAHLVGLRGFGSLSEGQRADGLGIALVLGSLSRRQAVEVSLAAAQLQSKDRGSIDTAPALSWWVASVHLAWSARFHLAGLHLEGGMVLGGSRFAVSATGPAERAGTRAAWTADIGLQGLARWPLTEQLAVDASLAVVLGLPRQRFTLDGVTEADTGVVRARASVGVAYLF